jgi:hypothetical protein
MDSVALTEVCGAGFASIAAPPLQLTAVVCGPMIPVSADGMQPPTEASVTLVQITR